MRLVFFGSPPIAVPFLEICADAGGWETVAVVAQPDRPAGRGMTLRSPAVAAAARRLGIALHQPENSKQIGAVVDALRPDLCVVVAYGRILKETVLAGAKLGFLNVHFSLLPKFRGAAPVQWSLLEGERLTGVSLFWLDAGMDSGPLQRRVETPVSPDEDALELFARLSSIGREALAETLTDIAAGRICREAQTGEATLAPKIKPDFGRITFNMPAQTVHNRIRGLRAGPACYLVLQRGEGEGLRVKLLKSRLDCEVGSTGGEDVPPGTVLRVDAEQGILVQFNPGRLWLKEVQPEGKKQRTSADFLNGLRLGAGARLSAGS